MLIIQQQHNISLLLTLNCRTKIACPFFYFIFLHFYYITLYYRCVTTTTLVLSLAETKQNNFFILLRHILYTYTCQLFVFLFLLIFSCFLVIAFLPFTRLVQVSGRVVNDTKQLTLKVIRCRVQTLTERTQRFHRRSFIGDDVSTGLSASC